MMQEMRTPNRRPSELLGGGVDEHIRALPWPTQEKKCPGWKCESTFFPPGPWTKVRKYDLPGHLVSKKYAEPACDHHQRIFFTMVPRVVPTIVFFLRFSPKSFLKYDLARKS